MKILVRLVSGAALALSALGTHAAVKAPAPLNGIGQDPLVQRIDQSIVVLGIDPASQQGRMLERWATTVARDPDMRRLFEQARPAQGRTAAAGANPWGPLNLAALSVADRRKFIEIVDSAVSQKDDATCSALQGTGRDFGALVRDMPPKQLDALLEIATHALKAQAQSSTQASAKGLAQGSAQGSAQPGPTYTLEQRLEAEGMLLQRMSVALASDPQLAADLTGKDGQPPKPTCRSIRKVMSLILAMPEPQQDIETLELMNQKSFGKVTSGVLAAPWAYLRDEYRLDDLPDGMRTIVGEQDRHPSTFGTLFASGVERNARKPDESNGYSTLYRPLGDTGAVQRLDRFDNHGHVYAGYFAVQYGVLVLKDKNLSESDAKDPPMLMPQSAYAQLRTVIPKPESHFEFSDTQSASGRARQVVCDSSAAYPASKINPVLDGQSFDLSCDLTDTDGSVFHSRDAYLVDYGVLLRLVTIDDQGIWMRELQNVKLIR